MQNEGLPEGISKFDAWVVEFVGKSSLWISSICDTGFVGGLFLISASIHFFVESKMTFEFAVQLASVGSILTSFQLLWLVRAGAQSQALIGFILFICGEIFTLSVLLVFFNLRSAYREQVLLAIFINCIFLILIAQTIRKRLADADFP